MDAVVAKFIKEHMPDNNDVYLMFRYLNKADDAKKRNIEFTLSFAEYKRILSRKRCFYTGVIMTTDDKSPNQKTLDRIDASKGYTKDNTVACAKYFNLKKKDLTIAEIKIMFNCLHKLNKL